MFKTQLINGIPQHKKCTKCRKHPPKTIRDKSITQLRKLAVTYFHAFIRQRDRLSETHFKCPTCGKIKRIEGNNYHACHIFPAGHYPALAFNEDNVHGGCLACNYFKHGVSNEYVIWAQKHLGEDRWNNLVFLKDYWRGRVYKWDKETLINIIETYKPYYEQKPNTINEGNVHRGQGKGKAL